MSKKLPRIVRQCQACQVEFETTARRIADGRGKYCSRKCSGNGRQPEHGHSSHSSQSPTYNSWAGMIQRCTNERHPKFPRYGARGVSVDPSWRSFPKFLADMGERPAGTTLDRRDNDGPYCKANCRWASRKVQQNNQSNTTIVTFAGERVPLSELSERLNIPKATLKYRIDSGWPQDHWGWPRWGGNRH